MPLRTHQNTQDPLRATRNVEQLRPLQNLPEPLEPSSPGALQSKTRIPPDPSEPRGTPRTPWNPSKHLRNTQNP
eukprot:3214279-Alexandrium_andersonii.AAC.1